MNVLEVNCSDLIGHIFDGYDLMESLNSQSDYRVRQVVALKQSANDDVICVSKTKVITDILSAVERKHHVNNIFSFCGEEILNLPEYKDADIVHFHILHNGFVSLLDYPDLFKGKKCVWTIHDPWILTANCIYPLSCNQWKTKCMECPIEGDFRYGKDDAGNEFMWKVKEEILREINPHIVVSSSFMKNMIEQSPLTKHFGKIHQISFGVDSNKYHPKTKLDRRRQMGISENRIVIGIREGGIIKGSEYAYEALRRLPNIWDKIELVIVGGFAELNGLENRLKITQLGWIQNEEEMIHILEACDIFLMPSLAETFGLMAIEAMAAECAVVCFAGTVVEEIIRAPECGIAAEYCSVDSLKNEISKLVLNPTEASIRGKLGRKLVENEYQYSKYVNKHKKLYEQIYCE